MTKEKSMVATELFLSFKEGNELAFRYIFDNYYQKLFHKTRQFCNNELEAEEIVQETFIQLYLCRDEIKEYEAIYPLLLTIAKRMAISAFRKRLVRARYETHILNNQSTSSFEVDQQVYTSEALQLWNEVIQELPTQQQFIYRLNKFEHLSYEEIAVESGISKRTVRNHLYLANKFVRSKMEKLLIFLLIFF